MLRQGRDPLKGCAAGIDEDELGNTIQIRKGKLCHHIDKPTMADLVTGGESVDVANQLVWFAYVAADNARQGFIDLAFVRKFHDRNVKTLFIDTMRVRSEPASANVHNMRGACEETDQRAVMEGRRDHCYVVQMPCAFPWIIGDIDIAVMDIVAPNPADEMWHRIGHRIDVARCPSHRLCQHVAIHIIDPR